MTLTENEIQVLQAIIISEYQDGSNPVNHLVWTFTISDNCKLVGKVISGTCASLVEKKFINSCKGDVKNEDCVSITEAGMEAYLKQTNSLPVFRYCELPPTVTVVAV